MISYIKGIVAKKGLDYLIIENNGIGYYINTSAMTLGSLSENDQASVFTYMHIREDILALYGFADNSELEMFKKLISVNGVGPKAGLSILSTYDINNLKLCILNEDANALSKVPGIGKKTAGKIILDLKDKVVLDDIDDVKITEQDAQIKPITSTRSNIDDAVSVLTTLGFSKAEAEKAVINIDFEGKNENQIIKEALKNLNR